MSATIPKISKKLLLPNSTTPHNTFGTLAINTSMKRVHSYLDSQASEGSSRLPSQKLIKSPNPVALLVSPPLKKGVSCNQSSNNVYMFINNDRYVQSENSSGLIGPLSSSSSQPNRNSYDYKSPNHFWNLGKRYNKEPYSSSGRPFTETFYRRIEDFLEAEGLSLVDASDYNRADLKRIRRSLLPSIRLGKENTSENSDEAEMVRSALHSPKLISDSLMASDLFKRRASHSQKPLKTLTIIGEDSPLPKRKPSRLDLKLRSPIMEKDTPRMSSRGSMWNTPATAMKGFVFFGQFQPTEKTKAVSRDNSPESGKITGMGNLKGAQSVHGKVNGNFF